MTGYYVFVFGEPAWFEAQIDAVQHAIRAALSCDRKFIQVYDLKTRRSITW